jgi:hypothetical protein
VLRINEDAPFGCIYGTKKMFTPIKIDKVTTFSKAFGAKTQMMIDMGGASCLDTYGMTRSATLAPLVPWVSIFFC